jgi:hypothetical protein
LKLIAFHSWYGSIKASNALGRIISCDIVYFRSIALLFLEMCKVEAVRAIGVQFEKSRRNNAVLQINSLASNVPFSFQDKPSLVGNDKMVFDELAVEDVPTICEQSEPA